MRLAFALALARAAGAAAPRNATLAVDASALPPLVIAGADKGGTSDAFELLLRHGFASKQKFECEDPSSSPKVRDLCVARSKELGCLYRGGDAASHRDCYRRYAVRGALWMDATPNYLWGWVNGEDAASRLSALSPNSAVALLQPRRLRGARRDRAYGGDARGARALLRAAQRGAPGVPRGAPRPRRRAGAGRGRVVVDVRTRGKITARCR